LGLFIASMVCIFTPLIELMSDPYATFNGILFLIGCLIGVPVIPLVFVYKRIQLGNTQEFKDWCKGMFCVFANQIKDSKPPTLGS